jgi:hypothetical protein
VPVHEFEQRVDMAPLMTEQVIDLHEYRGTVATDAMWPQGTLPATRYGVQADRKEREHEGFSFDSTLGGGDFCMLGSK